jgi:hypothetical protein
MLSVRHRPAVQAHFFRHSVTVARRFRIAHNAVEGVAGHCSPFYTQEEIGERENISVQPVKDVIADFSAKLPENLKPAASHLVDFEVPLYNVRKKRAPGTLKPSARNIAAQRTPAKIRMCSAATRTGTHFPIRRRPGSNRIEQIPKMQSARNLRSARSIPTATCRERDEQ